ncbi:MAG: FxsA family protein [Acidimicrobiales bacterium]
MAMLIVGLLVWMFVEIAVIVAVSDAVSWLPTLLLLIVVGAAGAWVIKREGAASWRRVMDGIRAGQMPTNDLLDGFIVVVAGTLLLLPGFVSDLVALALALPPVRRVVRERMVESLQRRFTRRVGVAGGRGPTFGFGAPGYGAYQRPGGAGFGRGPAHDDDVIDLDAEEVFVDEPVAEIDPPREWPA